MKLRYSLIAAAALSVVSSCNKVGQPAVSPDCSDHLAVEVEKPVICNIGGDGRVSFDDTRSSARTGNDAVLYDLSVWAYDEGGRLAHSSYFGPENLNSITVQKVLGLGYASGAYTICLLGNFGNPEDDPALCAPSSLVDAMRWTYDVSGYRDFDRFPLYGISSGVTASNIRLSLRRLMSEYHFKYVKAPGNPNDYEIKSFVLSNVNKAVRPFEEGYAASATMSEHLTDRMSQGDLIRFNDSGDVTVYVSENMQGDLKPETITSFDRRTRDNLGEYGDLCTYFEISARVIERDDDEIKIFEDVKYRWYFGYGQNIDKCNFDVPRNVIFNVTINFDSETVCEKDWIIVPEREIRLAIVSPDEVLKGNSIPKSANLYCDGELIESEVNCDWSVETGADNIENRAGGLYGVKRGNATVKASCNYDGSRIFSMKTIEVKNDYRFFYREDADEYIDDEGFQGPTYVCDYYEEFYVTDNGVRVPLTGNLTIAGPDGAVYDGRPSFGYFIIGTGYYGYSWSRYLNSGYSWNFTLGEENLSVPGENITSEFKPQTVEIINRSSGWFDIFGLSVPPGGTSGISMSKIADGNDYVISGNCTATGNMGGYSYNSHITVGRTERLFHYMGDTKIYLF